MSLSVDIKKSFKGFTLDVAFEAGNETLGFLGASGCGKSLTLRCIAGIERPDEGKITVNDTVFFDKAANKKARVDLKPQQRKTALLFQSYQLFPNLTVESNIAAGIDPHIDKEERRRRIAEQLVRFDLDRFRTRYPSQLSGGQQQRVALARMLAARPSILMLDEPFSALDAHLKSALEQDLQQLFERHKGSILYVSHDIDEAFRFCDRIAVVNEGHLEEIDTKEHIVSDPQTLATVRLSGCKNTTSAQYIDPHHAFLPQWNIVVESKKTIPHDVAYCGLRAKFIRYAEKNDDHTYTIHVDHISDSRFERTALISFINDPNNMAKPNPNTQITLNEKDLSNASSSLNTSVFSNKSPESDEYGHYKCKGSSMDAYAPQIQWHINKLQADHRLPEKGDICRVTLDPAGLYFVNR